MKILHILGTDRLSGAENVVIDILSSLRLDNEVYYVSPDGPIRKHVEDAGTKFIPLARESVSEIRRICREISPDIVHACDPRISFKCALAGVTFVAHLHSNCPWMKKICPNSIALLYAAKRAAAVISVSESIKNEYVFSKLIYKKLFVIENTVKRDKILKASREGCAGSFDLVFIGRLVEEKGPVEFVKVFERVKEQRRDATAVMIGDGEMREEIERYISEHHIEGITLHGFDPDPYGIIASSKLTVMTSKVEGFGLVAVESMVLGKPVVAFSCGGLKSILNNDCGALCGGVEDASQAVLALLSDDSLYEKKSRAALERAERFCDFDAYIKKIKEIYEIAL